jgi:hypothetical protein
MLSYACGLEIVIIAGIIWLCKKCKHFIFGKKDKEQHGCCEDNNNKEQEKQ